MDFGRWILAMGFGHRVLTMEFVTSVEACNPGHCQHNWIKQEVDIDRNSPERKINLGCVA
jgi:hypothetical protein